MEEAELPRLESGDAHQRTRPRGIESRVTEREAAGGEGPRDVDVMRCDQETC